MQNPSLPPQGPVPEPTTHPSHRRRPPVIFGALLVLLGLYFLTRQLPARDLVDTQLIPWLVIAFGVIVWLVYIFVPPRSPDDVFWGAAALLSGAFLLLRYQIFPELEGWGVFWPMIPLIAGLATLVQWLFHPRRSWFSLPWGLTLGAVGLLGMAFTTRQLGAVEVVSYARYWPLLIVIAGLALLLRAVAGDRTR
jgi:hypothetical protein